MYAVLLLFPLSWGVACSAMHVWGMYGKPFSRPFDAYHIPFYADARCKRRIHLPKYPHLSSTSLPHLCIHGTMALPYDATPPPGDTPPAPHLAALDQPLDDHPAAVPPHVQSLMSRMSSAKVYLVDESPAILHLDGHARLREPAVRRLARQLDGLGDDGLQAWLDAVASESGVGVKANALYLSSELIQHLSTSKIFSWATGLGAQPMGRSSSLWILLTPAQGSSGSTIPRCTSSSPLPAWPSSHSPSSLKQASRCRLHQSLTMAKGHTDRSKATIHCKNVPPTHSHSPSSPVNPWHPSLRLPKKAGEKRKT